ncbi:prephenate dehydrogenase/arogenate dehydrogenase family protein [Selenomonadales bacterium OttesenSCG-928-I06]|nr:prephenate dehydrogenase/arogenate dehydrogenase family protein [Selenomonadales bacterium OttesenSCG-928-I06]
MINFPVAIIGLGLLGSSLGLALRKTFEGEIAIVGFDNDPEAMNSALKLKAVHYVTNNIKVAVEQAEVVFLALPMLQMIYVVKEIAPYMKKDAVITDVGSTKEHITEDILALLPPGVHFVPAHPMAGSEKSGPLAASADLFVGKKYVITPYKGINEEAVDKVKNLIEKMGADEHKMDIKKHDRIISLTSHIPQITSSALVNIIEEENIRSVSSLMGSGFESMTRLASSDPHMWTDICLTNRENIIKDIDKLRNMLNELKVAILEGDREKISQYFQKSQSIKASLKNREFI